ncbi:hypothetical protein L204_104330 [Cryptococcus depauperatus]
MMGSLGKTPASDLQQAAEWDADPDYLALSVKQRRAIDRAFQRGIKPDSFKQRKRRRMNGGEAMLVGDTFQDREQTDALDLDDDAGGFMVDDQGGFVLDDQDGGFLAEQGDEGGFMPDDDGGGFLPDDTRVVASDIDGHDLASSPNKKRVPLYILPKLLTSLGLPSDDDVIQVFRASASGWSESSARRNRVQGDVEEGGVELKDFRAVCAALMGPEDMADDHPADGLDTSSGDEDVFEPSDSPDLSSGAESSYTGPGSRIGRRPNKPDKTGLSGKSAKGSAKLSAYQRTMVEAIWKMLKPTAKQSRGVDILGRDEMKQWVRTLGEMWSDEEITDMVVLFSSQHEGRGLSFDDFGKVMLRAGLV